MDYFFQTDGMNYIVMKSAESLWEKAIEKNIASYYLLYDQWLVIVQQTVGNALIAAYIKKQGHTVRVSLMVGNSF